MTPRRPDVSGLRALFVNCTLKPSPLESHTAGLMTVSAAIMRPGFFLVHRWTGAMTFGDNSMNDSGHEFFDYVPATGTYRTRFFNNLGPYDESGSSYVGDFDGNGLVVVGPDVITYDGDLPDGQGGWNPWMYATLTRIG